MIEYKQVKISIDAKLAGAFKDHCAKEGITMTSKIADFMRIEIGLVPEVQNRHLPFQTRRQRRQAAKALADEVRRLRDAEDAYRVRIPENLTGADAYSMAEEAIDALDSAAELLHEAF